MQYFSQQNNRSAAFEAFVPPACKSDDRRPWIADRVRDGGGTVSALAPNRSLFYVMHMHHESPPACVCTTLRKAARAVTRVYDDALGESGININQFAILRHLDRQGPQPLSRLAETLVMDRTSLYRALRPLEREGWVAIADAEVGRARIVTLTEAGRIEMAAAAEAWHDAQDRMVEAIGPASWSALQASLGDLVRIAGAERAA
jgi:DNA-binding MarR family transcriptional regulator